MYLNTYVTCSAERNSTKQKGWAAGPYHDPRRIAQPKHSHSVVGLECEELLGITSKMDKDRIISRSVSRNLGPQCEIEYGALCLIQVRTLHNYITQVIKELAVFIINFIN
jgi:hypothetical protein